MHHLVKDDGCSVFRYGLVDLVVWRRSVPAEGDCPDAPGRRTALGSRRAVLPLRRTIAARGWGQGSWLAHGSQGRPWLRKLLALAGPDFDQATADQLKPNRARYRELRAKTPDKSGSMQSDGV